MGDQYARGCSSGGGRFSGGEGSARWPAVMLSLLASMLFCGCPAQNTYVPPPPAPVTVARPLKQTILVYMEENGRPEAVQRADVRARVKGFLEEKLFEPGPGKLGDVEKGQVLYRIEKDRYVAARDSAKATVDAAVVGVTRAKQEMDRQANLLKENATAKSAYEQAKAIHDAAIAERAKSEAELKLAELDVRYTEVKAPISGRITKTFVKVGNLVEDGTQLATVINHDPIYVNFNINERDLLAIEARARKRQQNDGADDDARVDYRTIPVYLRRANDQGFPFEGRLDYADVEGVDPATGTMAVRAVFDNPDGRILPGYFVRVRLPINRREDAILIPAGAISRDQLGSFVLVVNSENKVERKGVETGSQYGPMLVVESGLEADDRVIVEGLQQARQGQEVAPTESTLEPVKDELQETHSPPEDATGAETDAKPDAGAGPTKE